MFIYNLFVFFLMNFCLIVKRKMKRMMIDDDDHDENVVVKIPVLVIVI